MLVGAVGAHADPADLDPSFSGDGKLLADFNTLNPFGDVAVQSDGKLLIAIGRPPAGLTVARYNADPTWFCSQTGRSWSRGEPAAVPAPTSPWPA